MGCGQRITAIQVWMAVGLGKYGMFVARHPVAVVICSLLFVAATAPGLLLIDRRLERRSLHILMDQSQRAYKQDEGWVAKTFHGSPSVVMINVRSRTGNLFTLEAMEQLWKVHMAISTQVLGEWDGRKWNLEDVCMTDPTGHCIVPGWPMMWGGNYSNYVAAMNAPVVLPNNSTIPPTDAIKLKRLWGTFNALGTYKIYSPFREFFALNFNFTDIGPNTRWVTQASSTRWVYVLQPLETLSLDHAMRWCSKVMTLMRSSKFLDTVPQLEVLPFSAYTVDMDHYSPGKYGDTALATGLVSVVVWVGIVFTRWGNMVRTRTSMAFFGIVSVGLAVISGSGIGLYIGIPWTYMNRFVVPFVALGLGSDNAFEVVQTFEEVYEMDPTVDLAKRARRVMNAVGTAIIMTTLTNVMAFSISAMSLTPGDFPALKYFALYTAIVCAVEQLILFTFYFGICIIMERRVEANRWDIFFCIKSKTPSRRDQLLAMLHEDEEQQHAYGAGPPVPQEVLRPVHQGAVPAETKTSTKGQPVAEAAEGLQGELAEPDYSLPAGKNSANSNNTGGGAGATSFEESEETFLQIMFGMWAVFVMKRWVKIVIVICTVGFLGYSLWAFWKIDEGFRPQDMCEHCSNDGPSMPWYRADIIDFQYEMGTELDMYFRGPHIDFSEPTTQLIMKKAFLDVLQRVPCLLGDITPKVTWLDQLQGFAAAATNGTAIDPATGMIRKSFFYPMLGAFLEGPGGRAASAMAFNPDGTLYSAFFPVRLFCWNNYDGKAGTKCFHDIYAAETLYAKWLGVEHVKTGQHGSVEAPVMFYGIQMLIMQHGQLKRYLVVDMAVDLCSVIIIGSLLLVNPVTVGIVVAMVVLLDIYVMGMLYAFGLHASLSSFAVTLVCIGLAVDYTVFTVYRFSMMPSGSRQEKAQAAIADSGPTVFVGSIAITLAVIPSCFGPILSVRVIGYMMQMASITGMILGLTFVPVMLSWFGPEAQLLRLESGHDREYSEFMKQSVSNAIERVSRANSIAPVANLTRALSIKPVGIVESGVNSTSFIQRKASTTLDSNGARDGNKRTTSGSTTTKRNQVAPDPASPSPYGGQNLSFRAPQAAAVEPAAPGYGASIASPPPISSPEPLLVFPAAPTPMLNSSSAPAISATVMATTSVHPSALGAPPTAGDDTALEVLHLDEETARGGDSGSTAARGPDGQLRSTASRAW